jgi:hypothetical protein
MFNQADYKLLEYVRHVAISTGTAKIEIPTELIEFVSEEGIKELKRFCKLNKIEIVGLTNKYKL